MLHDRGSPAGDKRGERASALGSRPGVWHRTAEVEYRSSMGEFQRKYFQGQLDKDREKVTELSTQNFLTETAMSIYAPNEAHANC